MYAVVNIKGQQFKVQEGSEIFVHRMQEEQGAKIAFDEVMLIDSDGDVQIGTPFLKAKVNATVLDHVQGDKVVVFKKKRRKGYKVKRGHRQQFTRIKVDSIN
jgi:large subunit ribosomal protein L21